MTRGVVSVRPDDSVIVAAGRMFEGDFDGLPVVDDKGILVGLVTQSNLISKQTNIHIPTLLIFLNKFDLYKKDRKFIGEQMEVVNNLRVRDVMNPEPPLVYEGESVERTFMQLSRTHGLSPTSVVNLSKHLLGVVTRYDILKTYNNKMQNSGWTLADARVNDEKVVKFLDDFNKKFIFISRWRAHMWLFINLAFLIAGIYLATLAIIRIQVV